MIYVQIAAAVVSILLGMTQVVRESSPLFGKMNVSMLGMNGRILYNNAQMKARMIESMNISWQYHGNDGTWWYYRDSTGRYWLRTNTQGVREYCESPQTPIL